MKKTVRYKKGLNGSLERKLKEYFMRQSGWRVVAEEDETQYNGGKGLALFVLFPLLAFFGQSNYIKVTYEK